MRFFNFRKQIASHVVTNLEPAWRQVQDRAVLGHFEVQSAEDLLLLRIAAVSHLVDKDEKNVALAKTFLEGTKIGPNDFNTLVPLAANTSRWNSVAILSRDVAPDSTAIHYRISRQQENNTVTMDQLAFFKKEVQSISQTLSGIGYERSNPLRPRRRLPKCLNPADIPRTVSSPV